MIRAVKVSAEGWLYEVSSSSLVWILSIRDFFYLTSMPVFSWQLSSENIASYFCDHCLWFDLQVPYSRKDRFDYIYILRKKTKSPRMQQQPLSARTKIKTSPFPSFPWIFSNKSVTVQLVGMQGILFSTRPRLWGRKPGIWAGPDHQHGRLGHGWCCPGDGSWAAARNGGFLAASRNEWHVCEHVCVFITFRWSC